MPLSAIYILSGLAGLAGAILAFIFIIPESKRASLTNPFWQFLHDLFNFKTLLLERILKFLYILATLTTIVMGSLMLFWVESVEHYDYWDGTYTTTEWYGYYGLLVLIFGPVLIRIFYEFAIMTVLLVQNVIDINKKLDKKASKETVTEVSAAPVVEEAPQTPAAPVVEETPPVAATPKINFCPSCGSRVGADGKCPTCGEQY